MQVRKMHDRFPREHAGHGEDSPPERVALVRDSFTIPESEYALLAELKRRCMLSGVDVKKTEIVRAGVLLLAQLTEAELLAAVGRVPRIKTGRPKGEK